MPDLVPWLPWIVGALLVFLVVVVWLGRRDVTKAVTRMGAAVTRMDQSLLKMDKSADAAQAAREAANAARDAAKGAEVSANACMAMVREVALWRQERENPGAR
jgi:Sec-independent protein translocase protein TatA